MTIHKSGRGMDVIVNADDLGMSLDINDAIFNLVHKGVVTSATVMANGPSVEAACERIWAYPDCSFGVHLNITEFRPLSSPKKLQPILNDEGEFDGERIRRVRINSDLAEGIFQEYCTQIDLLHGLGVPVSHIDSHNYVHTIPRIFPILKKIQRKFEIRRVRLSRNIYADGLAARTLATPGELGLDPDASMADASILLRLKKAVFNFMLKHYYHTTTTEGFSGFRLFYENAKTRKLKHRSFEVVVHPGNEYYDDSEVDILRGPWRDDLDFPVRLISYNAL